MEAKSERWILENHLSKFYGKLPSSIANEPSDNLFEEEKMFLFYLEAYWGGKSKEVQMVAVLIREIDDIIDRDDFDLVPESIKNSVKRLAESAPNPEERRRIEETMKNTAGRNKVSEIEKIFDDLAEVMRSEDLAKLKQETQKKIASRGVSGRIGMTQGGGDSDG